MSEGVAAGSFAKALASLKAYDDDLVAKMEEAVRFLQLNRGESGIVTTSVKSCHNSAAMKALFAARRLGRHMSLCKHEILP